MASRTITVSARIAGDRETVRVGGAVMRRPRRSGSAAARRRARRGRRAEVDPSGTPAASHLRRGGAGSAVNMPHSQRLPPAWRVDVELWVSWPLSYSGDDEAPHRVSGLIDRGNNAALATAVTSGRCQSRYDTSNPVKPARRASSRILSQFSHPIRGHREQRLQAKPTAVRETGLPGSASASGGPCMSGHRLRHP